MQDMAVRLSGYLSKLSLPSLGVTDILEIALISFFIYQFMVWIKFTRAYTLLKGILIVLLFILFAYVLKMNTILWIVSKLAGALITAIVVIFQPELRKVIVAEGAGGLHVLDQLRAQLLDAVVDLLLHLLQVGAGQFVIHDGFLLL